MDNQCMFTLLVHCSPKALTLPNSPSGLTQATVGHLGLSLLVQKCKSGTFTFSQLTEACTSPFLLSSLVSLSKLSRIITRSGNSFSTLLLSILGRWALGVLLGFSLYPHLIAGRARLCQRQEIMASSFFLWRLNVAGMRGWQCQWRALCFWEAHCGGLTGF